MTAATKAGLARLNELPAAEARQALHACCAATAWLDDLVAGRPYPDRAALLEPIGGGARQPGLGRRPRGAGCAPTHR